MLILLQNICRLINKWVEITLAAIGISMTMVVVAQVFYRYVLNNSLFWSEELARYMLVWISFLGATTAYYRGVHPGVDVVVQKLTKHIQWFCKLLVHFLSMLLFLAITIGGVQFAYFIRMQISPALGINKWLILSIIPISSTILIVYAVTFFLATLKGMKNGQ